MQRRVSNLLLSFVPVAAMAFVGCVGTGPAEPEPSTNEPEPSAGFPDDVYDFESRFSAGESSVAYNGQVQRHALIEALKGFVGGLNDLSYSAGTLPETIATDLQFFYDYKNAGGTGDESLPFSFDLPTSQATFSDIGSAASLFEKMPDQDAGWTTGVVGFSDGTLLPTEVVSAMFTDLSTSVAARADGAVPIDPTGAAISSPFITADGVDYQQLVQKFLDGAVAYSQATDDYLDDDTEGKGLLSDNSAADDGAPYTALEHAWDEAFGYFGAARHAIRLSDDEIAAGAFDANGDETIDLTQELNQGHALNAAKRDRAAVVATDFSHDALSAFLDGRNVIRDADGPLNATETAALKAARDALTRAWENALAATVVHYINDVLGDMNRIGTDAYVFSDHAKHWSELKGFALVLQFNPQMSLSPSDFATVHEKIGNAPVLGNAAEADIEAYRAALIEARTLIGAAQSFDVGNLGDDLGDGGW